MIIFQLTLNHKVQRVNIGTKMHEKSELYLQLILFLLGINNLAPSLHFPTAKEIPLKGTEILTYREVTLYEVTIDIPY